MTETVYKNIIIEEFQRNLLMHVPQYHYYHNKGQLDIYSRIGLKFSFKNPYYNLSDAKTTNDVMNAIPASTPASTYAGINVSTHVVYCCGLGHIQKDQPLERIQNNITYIASKYNLSSFYNIIKRYFKGDLDSSDYVTRVVIKVLELLEVGKRVILMGHSYGGAIAVYAAKQVIKSKPDLISNFFLITYGSLYIHNEPILGEQELHFMYVKDVVEKVNRLEYPKENLDGNEKINYFDGTRRIFWMWHLFSHMPIRDKNELLGTNEQWEIHNSYTNIIANLYHARTYIETVIQDFQKNKLKVQLTGNMYYLPPPAKTPAKNSKTVSA
jgi:hypothetical protein